MDELKEAIRKLHETLRTADHVDPELQGLLQTLDDDIHAALHIERPDGSPDSELEERARSLAARFASQHPTLEPILRDVADMLGKMGI